MSRTTFLIASLIFSFGFAATPYTVRSGDTLGSIANKSGTSASKIRSINPQIKNNIVKAGQVIKIPNRKLPPSNYKVKNGESLGFIADKFNTSLGSLIRANPEYKNTKNVWSGAVIHIPSRLVAANTHHSSSKLKISAHKINKKWAWPVPGYNYISSGFSVRSLEGKSAMHYGIDIVAPMGTKVVSAQAGRVIESRPDYDRGWGWTVVISHPNGWITRYAHLSKNLVKAGEWVVKKQAIGRVGNTGHSTGAHLHYGTYFKWNPRDPLLLY